MTQQEILNAYLSGLRDFRYADLTGANLTGADLAGANLTGAYLKGADLTEADLTEADLAGADLTEADLTEADLAGADLTGANLTRADLTGANLTRADLTGANLTRADLTGANLTRADRNDRELISSGSIGRAPSSGRTVTWLVYESGEPEIIAGCFNGTPAELRAAARNTHAEAPDALDWYLRVATWIARDSKDAQGRVSVRRAA